MYGLFGKTKPRTRTLRHYANDNIITFIKLVIVLNMSTKIMSNVKIKGLAVNNMLNQNLVNLSDRKSVFEAKFNDCIS